MKKKAIFNNAKVTRMMGKYAGHPQHHRVLRDKILKRIYPLVDAALSRKHIYTNRDDVRQECVVKILQGLPKFDAKRGTAFAFLWTIICNTCITQNQRLTSSALSLSTDEDVKREAEASSDNPFETPENRHILNHVSLALKAAFDRNGFRVPDQSLHRKALTQIRGSIQNGEFFFNRGPVMKKLKRIGLSREDIQYYIDYTLVKTRQSLLEARENTSALTVRQVGKDPSERVE